MTGSRAGFESLLRLVAGALSGALAAGAQANIDLTWSPPAHSVNVGDQLTIKLVVVSDNQTNQSIGALDALITWDTTYLDFIGSDQAGIPYPWSQTGFFPEPDGINANLNDGEIKFTALASPFSAPYAPPPPGMPVTNLKFKAKVPTPLTKIQYKATSGQYGKTAVYDFFVANLNVTGDFSDPGVVAIGCKTCPGDANGDQAVNQSDLGILLAAYGCCFADACYAPCADFDLDGCVTQSDLGILLAFYGQNCP